MLVTVALFFVYALMKRITYYSQVVLGVPFAWAIFFCVSMLGVSPFSRDHLAPTLALFAANMLWTITYDTIYAHQDVVGGVAAGMAYYIYDVDLKRPESCGAWFHNQFWIVGGGFITGLAGEYATRLSTP